MATLVQFLAAGVNGAANGTATFVLRGTASSAAAVLYNDFEGIAQPGTNIITLDANGAAEVYCDAYVDVEIKNSAGTTLRTVTVGNSAPVVEVQSTSFTGTDYDGNPANTIGEPITLKAVLDKWITSAGAPDWQVLRDGVATDLSVAFAGSLSGLVINVKDPDYGATGDGVTDDTTAIIAANVAAAGRPLYFPPGTYKVTTLAPSDVNLNWFGAGAGASVISGSTQTNLISITNNTNTGWKNFTGLSFTSSGTYDQLFGLEENQNVTFRNCTFDASNCTECAILSNDQTGLSKVLITDCDFIVGASTSFTIANEAATGNRLISVKGCNLKVPSGFTGTMIVGADFVVDGCRFDASAVTSGVYRHVDAEDGASSGKYVGSFVNNKFIDGGSGGFVFSLTNLSSGCDFAENGNTFVGFTAPSASGDKGQTYEITDADSGSPGDITLGSRKGRTVHLAITTGATTVSACLEAENVVLEHSGASIGNITIPALIPGLSGRVVLFHTANSTVFSVTFLDSGGFGAALKTATTVGGGTAENIIPLMGDDDRVASCSYFTTVRAAGTFRSLITSEVTHWV